MSYLNLYDARSEALFASTVQPSEQLTADRVRTEIMETVRRFGGRGCAARMAQEFGDAPHSAAARMRWARRVVADVYVVSAVRAPARLLVHAGRPAA